MKAQGLPLNTIVLGALAVLVLVILAAVFVPGIGSMFASIFGLAPDAYTNCQTTCTGLSGRFSSATIAANAAKNSAYCADPVPADDVTETCFDYITHCTVSLTGGDVIKIGESGTDGEYPEGTLDDMYYYCTAYVAP